MTTVISQLVGCCMSPNFRARRRAPVVGVQSSACLYLLLLSIVDMVSVFPVPFIVIDIATSKFNHGTWVCKFIFFCEAANKSLSPFVLTALSVDRYIAVCRPTLIWMRQTRFALGIILLCLVCSMFFIMPISISATVSNMLGVPGGVKCWVDLSRTFAFTLSIVLVCYVMPLIFICLVYIAILRRLYRHTHLSTVGRRTSISLSRVVKCSVLVVMFYFICWTPYWIQQINIIISGENGYNDSANSPKPLPRNDTYGTESNSTDKSNNKQTDVDNSARLQQMFMYIIHALPYTQSAFNWLFYAFLNHNLRHSSRCSLGARSATVTCGDNNVHTTSGTGSTVPLWKNIQTVGNYLKTASIDTGNTILRYSPFRPRSRIRSRSTTCLGSTNDVAMPALTTNGLLSVTGDGSTFFTSVVDLPGKDSIKNDVPSLSVQNISGGGGSRRSVGILQTNSFNHRPKCDFPLLGFSSAPNTSNPSSLGPTLRVPSKSPQSMTDGSSVSLNMASSFSSTAPASPNLDDAVHSDESETFVEWL
uniref:G_PROTEIN_RECEP_F1_2 domain-containing protein n=1 Tax=Panagrellus redivivus TaxID=6233 RepID=A0A7E4VRH6_PANRE